MLWRWIFNSEFISWKAGVTRARGRGRSIDKGAEMCLLSLGKEKKTLVLTCGYRPGSWESRADDGGKIENCHHATDGTGSGQGDKAFKEGNRDGAAVGWRLVSY